MADWAFPRGHRTSTLLYESIFAGSKSSWNGKLMGHEETILSGER